MHFAYSEFEAVKVVLVFELDDLAIHGGLEQLKVFLALGDLAQVYGVALFQLVGEVSELFIELIEKDLFRLLFEILEHFV